MMKTDWNKYRRTDYSIDLASAWADFALLTQKYDAESAKVRKGLMFLEQIENIYPIRSRQVAALAISMADNV